MAGGVGAIRTSCCKGWDEAEFGHAGRHQVLDGPRFPDHLISSCFHVEDSFEGSARSSCSARSSSGSGGSIKTHTHAAQATAAAPQQQLQRQPHGRAHGARLELV